MAEDLLGLGARDLSVGQAGRSVCRIALPDHDQPKPDRELYAQFLREVPQRWVQVQVSVRPWRNYTQPHPQCSRLSVALQRTGNLLIPPMHVEIQMS